MKLFTRLILLLSFTVLIDAYVYAQQLPKRYATIELFTNTPCGSCRAHNPGFFQLLDNYADDIHQISFYPGRPYQSCPIYQENKMENENYKTRRGSVFTPQVYLDGMGGVSSGSVSASDLDAIVQGESFLYVKVEESGDVNRTVDITLQTFDNTPSAQGRLFIAAVERAYSIPNPPGNWEANHHNVFRSFISNPEGELVDLTLASPSLNYSYSVDAGWDPDEMYVLAWVEHPTTKAVFNSGTRFDEAFSGVHSLNELEMIEVFPNPAIDEITLNIPEGVAANHLEILDIQGKLVKRQQVQSSIQVSDLSSGVYTILVFDETGAIFRSRFMKK